jgi:hypothetical protein
MAGEPDLAAGIAYMRQYCEEAGRETPPEVFCSSITVPGERWSAQSVIDRVGRYRELGVQGAAMGVEGNTRAEWCDNAERFGAEVLSKLD